MSKELKEELHTILEIAGSHCYRIANEASEKAKESLKDLPMDFVFQMNTNISKMISPLDDISNSCYLISRYLEKGEILIFDKNSTSLLRDLISLLKSEDFNNTRIREITDIIEVVLNEK